MVFLFHRKSDGVSFVTRIDEVHANRHHLVMKTGHWLENLEYHRVEFMDARPGLTQPSDHSTRLHKQVGSPVACVLVDVASFVTYKMDIEFMFASRRSRKRFPFCF
jgi:hypothetical protein